MKRIYITTAVLSILVVLIYLIFSTLAICNYPVQFSPVTNWLSDLGNHEISPNGSKYYNVGIILTGIVLAFFFIAFGTVRIKQIKSQNIILWMSQIFGVIGSFSMIMSGVFPIDKGNLHSFWSAMLYINIGSAFGLSVAALAYYKEINKWILFYGGLTTLTDLIVSTLFNKIPILEWPIVILFLSYCIILGIETMRLGKMRDEKLPSWNLIS